MQSEGVKQESAKKHCLVQIVLCSFRLGIVICVRVKPGVTGCGVVGRRSVEIERDSIINRPATTRILDSNERVMAHPSIQSIINHHRAWPAGCIPCLNLATKQNQTHIHTHEHGPSCFRLVVTASFLQPKPKPTIRMMVWVEMECLSGWGFRRKRRPVRLPADRSIDGDSRTPRRRRSSLLPWAAWDRSRRWGPSLSMGGVLDVRSRHHTRA